VGIATEITNLEWAQWLEQVFRGHDFDLTIISHTEPMDIGIYARDNYYFQYDSADMKTIMAELEVTSDPEARTALLHAAQRHIAEDFVVAFLFQLAKTGVANADIEGLWENAPVPANDLTGVRWAR
jgi:peptide/nickel transport system substrate-binding protein